MKKTQKKALAIGAGVTALAAAATGVYFLTGKHAKNRKKVAKWVGDMQQEVVKEIKKAGKTSQSAYNQAVDMVSKSYKGAKKISAADLALAAAELKSNWQAIKSEMDKASASIKKMAPKSVKTAAKKVAGARKATKKRR